MELYGTHKMQMASCDLLEWKSLTALGGAIRLVTRKRVNHSSILVRPQEYASLRERRFLIEALSGGLVPRLLSTRLQEFKGQVWWHGLKPSKVTQKQRNKMVVWAILETVKGTRYDYGSLFGNIFSRVNVDASRWFCSEAYTAMLQAGRLYKKDGKALRPGEFDPLGLHVPPVLIYDSSM
jgi:hypothetical protein